MMTDLIIFALIAIMVVFLCIFLIHEIIKKKNDKEESAESLADESLTSLLPKTHFDYRIAKGYLMDSNGEDEINCDQYPVFMRKNPVLYILWYQNKYYIRAVDPDSRITVDGMQIEVDVNVMLQNGNEICIEKGTIRKLQFEERIIEF